ncbi:alkaline phosphatase D family protein [Cryptosporangium aurantiacum]|uniref:Alkaline phosphatase D n=1 Tax=Cryptosporangium aurantiacum TaxID=134849 RepID=A0A1M7TWR4_9ACTN|nr:alkaline phosphatase D family protein [Cryptosporangium aurantiacum]SHN75171.1 alkaline phosphatase D [Cryptosporangium aurantiacum]
MDYPLPRRRFLALVGSAGAGFLGPALVGADGVRAGVPSRAATVVPAGVFTLGVASGDPLPDGVVLWTRLAPRPTEGGGMPERPVPVRWEVAADERFRTIVKAGTATAHASAAHSVHVDVRGLRPAADYFYRFRVGSQASPVGRTRTAPAPDARPRRLRFATASCQNWQDGYYTAYRSLADEDLDFVAFLGDYIYEAAPWTGLLRAHCGTGQPYTLEDYRNRHAQYRTDPDLARAHAAAPWVVSLDDHDVDDNWTGAEPADPSVREAVPFTARKAAGIRAFVEHMPVRVGPDTELYRRLRFGTLATLHVLDTRRYRSPHATTVAEAEEPWRTMTGPGQERWLIDGLTRAGSDWNLLANQVLWASVDSRAGPGERYSFDNWDGYRVQRRRLLEYLGSGAARNPVVLTGDQHATWACDVKPHPGVDGSPILAAELAGTSITSGGDPDVEAFRREHAPLLAENPHCKYIDNRRGYLLGELTATALRVRLRVVDTVTDPHGGAVRTGARFVVENDRPGVTLDGPPDLSGAPGGTVTPLGQRPPGR